MHDLDSMEEVIKCYRQGKGGEGLPLPYRQTLIVSHNTPLCWWTVAVDLEKASYWEERRDKEKAFQAGQA